MDETAHPIGEPGGGNQPFAAGNRRAGNPGIGNDIGPPGAWPAAVPETQSPSG